MRTRDGGYAALFEVLPTNYFLQSTAERIRIISNLAAWLRIVPDNLQDVYKRQPSAQGGAAVGTAEVAGAAIHVAGSGARAMNDLASFRKDVYKRQDQGLSGRHISAEPFHYPRRGGKTHQPRDQPFAACAGHRHPIHRCACFALGVSGDHQCGKPSRVTKKPPQRAVHVDDKRRM